MKRISIVVALVMLAGLTLSFQISSRVSANVAAGDVTSSGTLIQLSGD